MSNLREQISEKQPLTMGEVFALAKEYDARVVDIVIMETEIRTGLSREEILTKVMEEYAHNMKALEIGLKDGESILLGTVASQLNKIDGPKCFEDNFLDNALLYTLAAQVGNHCIGLRPCAGTGDSCPYAGFIKAVKDAGYDEKKTAECAALILKIGSLFRVGKVTTGCNMEGYGAGSACIAAATVALEDGTPDQMEKAMVLALSPTIGVPCTPRVLVPALCTTHVGGAILNGMYSARLCMKVDMTVNVPFDVMLAMASIVHVESGHAIVPTVVEYMEPFFKRKPAVESLVSDEVKEKEAKKIEETLEKAGEIAKSMAKGTNDILDTFGDAVVGGSSQAVGSPTNAARIAHELAEGKIKKVTVELYPELFARRSINIPGVLMGAVYGASTSDYEMYNKAVQMVKADGIEVDIVEGTEHAIQKITLETDKGVYFVDALNRGGGRLVLRDATSMEQAKAAADRLGIVLVDA
ncbi:MAG: L-serine ammonia-lyase, iron-sulfur-dependent, subunit alpha [Lachnospiraceae bacterium]|nr:L-serine ammonia-lyase, iron-sulfur-dependent, subunit alpha [Lachnospiraceae bacterium]